MAFHNVPPNGFPDLPDMEELEAVVKDVSGIKTSVVGLTEDVSDLNDNKANQITIAPFFSAETAYEVGDLVYYNGLTYRCTNDHEGEWDADDFAATTIENELATLKSGLTNIVKTVTETITTNSNRWLIFPEGRTILAATIGDDDTVVLTYADQVGYLSRFHFYENVTTPQFELYDANTDYTVRYSYI